MTDTPKQKALALLKPPFKFYAGYIFDSAEKQNKVSDDWDCELVTIARLRVWGRFGYLPDGAEIHDAIGEVIAEALNQYFERIERKCGAHLLSCPFCGSTDISEGEALSEKDGKRYKQTGCTDCGAMGPVKLVSDIYDNAPANKAWNIRA